MIAYDIHELLRWSWGNQLSITKCDKGGVTMTLKRCLLYGQSLTKLVAFAAMSENKGSVMGPFIVLFH